MQWILSAIRGGFIQFVLSSGWRETCNVCASSFSRLDGERLASFNCHVAPGVPGYLVLPLPSNPQPSKMVMVVGHTPMFAAATWS